MSAFPPIRGFYESTLIDWPGRVAAEVFVGGCNFRCGFCHASHLVVNPNQLEEIAAADVFAYLRRQRGWIDGVVISGGEPTIDPRLPAFIDALRAAGAAVKLDTNGSRPDVLRALLERGVLAAVAMDIKAPLDDRYHAAAGVEVDLAAIRESIELLFASAEVVRNANDAGTRGRGDAGIPSAESGGQPDGGRDAETADVKSQISDFKSPLPASPRPRVPASSASPIWLEFRTTVCPRYHTPADIIEIAQTIAGAPRYCLQPFHPAHVLDPALAEVAPYSADEMQSMARAAGEFVGACTVRGR